ncbi:MAG: hypothetical protein WBI18_08805, partial [Candidatus Saccharicenans sp.]
MGAIDVAFDILIGVNRGIGMLKALRGKIHVFGFIDMSIFVGIGVSNILMGNIFVGHVGMK